MFCVAIIAKIVEVGHLVKYIVSQLLFTLFTV